MLSGRVGNAVDALAGALDAKLPTDWLKAAQEVLNRTQPAIATAGPTDAKEIVLAVLFGRVRRLQSGRRLSAVSATPDSFPNGRIKPSEPLGFLELKKSAAWEFLGFWELWVPSGHASLI